MISLRQKLLKRVADLQNIRTTSNTAVQDELDDKNISTSKTRSKRIISIASPFPKGEKCFVDTENGGYFCAKSGHFGDWMTLKGALRLSRNDPAALRHYSVGDLLDYQRIQDVIKPKELGLPEDIEIALLEEAKTNNDVEYPLEYDCVFYKRYSGNKRPDDRIRRLFILQSGESIFLDCDVTLPKTVTRLSPNFYHAAKIYPEDSSPSFIPSKRPKTSIQSAYLGLFTWRDYKKLLLVPDEWDAMTIEAAGLRNLGWGVMPIRDLEFESESGRVIDPRILPILAHMNEIQIWPFDLAVEKSEFFESLDQSKIWIQNESIPSPKYFTGRDHLMQVIKHEAEEFINLGANIAPAVDLLHKPDSSIKFSRFSELNSIMGGFRKGELTLFSGHTGKGKTTFLSEYTIDLALNGVKNLWGSFELKLDALQRMQIMQLRHMTFEEALSDENLDSTQEMFKNLNMKALNVEAISMDYQTLEKKLIRAVEELNVEHIIIDNLQFLLYGENDSMIFTNQDNAVRMFRNLATKYNVHVTLVIHPRKTSTKTGGLALINEYDLAGRARAIQEADNVIIMQTKLERGEPREDWIQIVKCRHGNGLGSVNVSYDPASKTYHQASGYCRESEEKRVNFLLDLEQEIDLDDVIREKFKNSTAENVVLDRDFNSDLEKDEDIVVENAENAHKLFPDLAQLRNFSTLFWQDSPKN